VWIAVFNPAAAKALGRMKVVLRSSEKNVAAADLQIAYIALVKGLSS
jgi:predicted nucleic acid-binding protein